MPPAKQMIVAAPEFDFDQFAMSEEEQKDIRPEEVLIYGQPGTGKTTAIAKASEYWPRDPAWWDTPVEQREWVVLKDMIWNSFDKDATVSLRAHRIRPAVEFYVPRLLSPLLPSEYTKDEKGNAVPSRPYYKSVIELIPKLVEMNRVAVEKTGANKIVGDTLSQLDNLLSKDVEQMRLDGLISEKNKFEKFDKIYIYHMQLYSGLGSIAVRKYYAFHTAANNAAFDALDDKATAEDRAKAEAKGVAGDNFLKPQITGKAGSVYVGNNSLQVVIRAEDQGSGKGLRRFIEFFGGGYQVKNRYESILKGRMDADLGLLDQRLIAISGM